MDVDKMVNKQWLIKLTGEDDLFYDSEEKVYRWRMHCPQCGKVSGCQCFQDLESAECAEGEDNAYCCSSKCALILNDNEGEDGITEAMRELGIIRNIDDLSYPELIQIVNELDRRENEILKENKPRLRGRMLSTTWARMHLGYRVPIDMLMAEDVIEILELLNQEDLLICIEDIYELMQDMGIQKTVKTVTEEEARKILDACDFDFEPPGGESCNT